MSNFKSPYFQVLSKKRSWTPVAIHREPLKAGAEESIYRALALRCLELPVKEFLDQGLKGELPTTPGVIEILKSNQADEDRHDLAFEYAIQAHGTNAKAEREAQHILKTMLEDPSHPILKAAILERSVFFVLLPFYRFNGDKGLRTIAADISRDEQTHVTSHHMICKELGIKPSASLNRLRRAIVSWVMEPLEAKTENQWQSKDFWLKQSDDLYTKGSATGLTQTSASTMHAFFESPNTSLPSYG